MHGVDRFWMIPKRTLCIYGSKLPAVAHVTKGEILCVVCPMRKVAQSLIMTDVESEFETRPGAKFNNLRPIEIDNHYTKWTPSNWTDVANMSGSPIFNSAGKLVSIYGLGKIEERTIIADGMSASSAVSKSALTVMAPDIRPEIVPDVFFRIAPTEVVTNNYESPKTYFLCVAPTGRGKTIYFTKNLVELMPSKRNVALLKPTAAAVVGAYKRISELLKVSGNGHSMYTIKYLIGQRHEVGTERAGKSDRLLTLMTYGRAISQLQSIQNVYDYILLDEIHNLNDPTVLACDLALTKPNARYKCCSVEPEQVNSLMDKYSVNTANDKTLGLVLLARMVF
ncbi:uncharacterized protein LOC128876037 [Hylaeus volcanicus]|uniref:uncharacterized protein LOC128876037 n=1 Tax=Hylaeus volcanicus TaxID=313075 RepID=UPI0023B83529|nr:uncharacterized protein LOC128876037 [Hylaeus volcanicus]